MDVKDLLNRVAENLSVRRAFGEAYEKDAVTIIPVAFVAGGGGGGEGGPPSGVVHHDDNDDADNDDADTLVDNGAVGGEIASGSGGGFGGVVIPLGAYVVKDEQVRWVPAVNVTLIVLAALSVVRLVTKSGTKALKRRRG